MLMTTGASSMFNIYVCICICAAEARWYIPHIHIHTHNANTQTHTYTHVHNTHACITGDAVRLELQHTYKLQFDVL